MNKISSGSDFFQRMVCFQRVPVSVKFCLKRILKNPVRKKRRNLKGIRPSGMQVSDFSEIIGQF